jgi:hypothetical protein
MDTKIDTMPPPAPSLRKLIEGLQPGQSLCAPSHSIRVLRVTASRIKAVFPDREFKFAEAEDGPRIWRLA